MGLVSNRCYYTYVRGGPLIRSEYPVSIMELFESYSTELLKLSNVGPGDIEGVAFETYEEGCILPRSLS